MNSEPPAELESDHDAQLAQLLGQLTDRLKAGEPVDLEAFLQQCPDYAAELRQIFPAMLVLADLDGAPSMLTDDGAPAVVDIDPVRGVLGDYRIVRQIGRGGMGVVFEAEQISLGRQRAWKKAVFSQFLREGPWVGPDGIEYMGDSVRTERYRYVEWKNWKTGKLIARELYDLKRDPQENVNVVGLPNNQRLSSRLAKQLKMNWQAARPSDPVHADAGGS